MFRAPLSFPRFAGLAFLAGLFGTFTAQAAFPPPEFAPSLNAAAAIVFANPQPQTAANSDVWIMNADGTNPQQLTTAVGDDIRPSLSPDGTKIVYERFYNGAWSGWVMNRDGTNPTQLNLPGNSTRLAWSPDGQKIAFASDAVDWWEIWTVNADGTGAQRLTSNPGPAGEPSWSPDGQKIVFDINSPIIAGYEDLYTVNSDGTGQSVLISTATGYSYIESAWSPDGAQIAAIRWPAGSTTGPYALWVMDANGTNGQTLVSDIDSFTQDRLSWSADSNWILFTKGNQIWRIQRNGSDLQLVGDGWQSHTNVINFPGTSKLPAVYLPFVLTTPSRGIYGQVTDQGLPAADVPLELRFYNGATWATRATATTDDNGAYAFTHVPNLFGGQRYAVRYINTTDPAHLYTWRNAELLTYTNQQEVAQATFDIANITLSSPIAGSARGLPITFQWVPRAATLSDSYQLDLFDPSDGSPSFFTNPALGYANAYTLAGLPSGFGYNTWYAWDITALSPAGGSGVSYYAYAIGFSNGLQTLEPLAPTDRVRPAPDDRSIPPDW